MARPAKAPISPLGKSKFAIVVTTVMNVSIGRISSLS
jgi:hypothetical protein